MSFNKTLEEVKKAGEDFEWYPTSRKMIEMVSDDLTRCGSIRIMDVGAGNGSFFEILDSLKPTAVDKYDRIKDYREYKKYAIEKSQVLINAMPSDIFIVGTDFHQQVFMDKKMDVIFCNPPYSEFEEWMNKLILEANTKTIYFIVPERWENSELLKQSIEKRNASTRVLGSFSFIDSEFRKARANINIVKVSMDTDYKADDPFKVWFNSNFDIDAEKNIYTIETEARKEKKEKIAGAIVDKSKMVDNLVKLYNSDMENLLKNYKSLEGLDSDLLAELSINIHNIISGLQIKIQGLKDLYWRELFNNLEQLTSRLTTKARKGLLDTLLENSSVDFSHENIYSIIIWAIKNTNKHIDSQLVDLYKDLTQPKNVQGYKSNRHMVEDTWKHLDRWKFKDIKRYKLDYRLVKEHWNAFGTTYDCTGNLSNSVHDFIGDIFAIARNLGFKVENDSKIREWEAGKKQGFYTPEGELFAEIKAFKNGNIHYKLDQEFLKKFNVEAGRLLGWLKTPKEASDELEIPEKEVAKMYRSNMILENKNIKLLV